MIGQHEQSKEATDGGSCIQQPPTENKTQSEQLSASSSDSETHREQDNVVLTAADMGTQTCVRC